MTTATRRAYRLVRTSGPAVPVPVRVDGPRQRQVIAHTSGPLLVLGGPGTGKTSVLVESVAARVAAGADPESVLVLTFGRRGASTLRDRITARLAGVGPVPGGGPGAGPVSGGGAGPVSGGGAGPDGGRDPGAIAEPLVRTFPAYAFGLLRRAAAEAGQASPRLLTAPEQDLVIRELLEPLGPLADDDPIGWPDSLRAALPTRAFATELRDLLLRAAERGVGPAGLDQYGAVLQRTDWAAVARFYAQYLEVLALRDATERGSVGYAAAELVRAATALLVENPELLDAERRRLSTVYVDEYADTDPAQVDLLETLVAGGKHVVVFGDPDSSTFAFRGADPTGVHAFPDRFRTAAGVSAPTVTLDRSYRSGPELVTATRRVAARLRGPARHRALKATDAECTVEVRTFRSGALESAHLAHRLREAHLLHGIPWQRMAVVVRSTLRQLAPLQRALNQAGVPTTTESEDIPLPAQPAVAPLLLLLQCALDPERLDEEAAVALLHSPLGGADPLAERRLRQGLRALAFSIGDRRPSGVLLVEALNEPGDLLAVERRWARPAQAVATLLRIARETRQATVEDVLWAVWRASGLADRWAAASARGGHRGAAADRDLDAVVALFDTAARFVDRLPGARTEVFLDHLLGQELPADSIAPTADRGAAVRVLTAHAAKGLEWDFVAVVGVQEGTWPDLRLRGSVLGSEILVDAVAGRELGVPGRITALLDEERRLFYVATTRARKALLVTAVAGGDDEEQPSRFLHELLPPDDGDGPPVPESRPPDPPLTLPTLVARLRTVAADPNASPARRRAAAARLADLAAQGVRGADPDEWWGLPDLSDERPLVDPGDAVTVTPSTVDTVNRCSLRWLLERHGGSTAFSPEQGVGNLVHATAMLAHDATVDRAELAAYLAERFDAIELSARWLAGRERQRAEGMLDKLIGWLADNPRRLVAIERDFLVRLDDPDAPVDLKGRVDRLEIDDQGRLVVIDLKTGKSAPTEADLEEHAQLGVYQVAVEEGAFEESTEAGGASLVQLGGTQQSAKEQSQPALAAAEDPEWARALVKRTAQTMAASTFEAVANNKCRVCPVRTSCPISGKGRQVAGGD